jgi:hypothetical protein
VASYLKSLAGSSGASEKEEDEKEDEAAGSDSTTAATTKTDAAKPDTPAAEPKKETPSRIDLLKPPRSIRDLKGSKNYKKFMASLLDFFGNQMKIDIKIAKKIVRDIWAKTPVSGKFNKLVFKEQMEKEIDIAAILANSGLNPTQQIKVLGALKKWAAQNSDLIDDRMTRILRLRDKEKQKAPPPPEPTPEPAPAPQREPVSEPQVAEEPLKIITKILGEKGVDEEKVSAFINDLREMGVIQEMAPGALKRNLKMNKVEWVEFSQKHPEVIEAISQLRGRSKKARALQAQFKDALSGIIAREEEPPMPRIRRKKKSTAASKSKTDSTPAAVTPAEPAPQAVPEPAPAPEPRPPEPESPEPEPKRKKKTAPPIKNQKAYDHGKQGKAIGSKGTLLPNPVQDIEKAIFGLTRIKSNSDDQDFKDKIDSYIRGLYYFQDEKEELNESLMLRWKTIAGIK